MVEHVAVRQVQLSRHDDVVRLANSSASATSSLRPARAKGAFRLAASNRPAGLSAHHAVSMTPGETALTRSGANSRARVGVMRSSAAAEVVTPDTGSVQEDVRILLRSAFHVLRVGRQKVVVTLMAEAQLNDNFADQLSAYVFSRIVAAPPWAECATPSDGSVRRGDVTPQAGFQHS